MRPLRAVFADYSQGSIVLTAVPVVTFDEGEPYVLAESRLEAVPVWERIDTLGAFVGLIYGHEDPDVLRPQAESMLAEVEAELTVNWVRH